MQMYSGKTAQFDFSKIAIVNEPSRHTTHSVQMHLVKYMYIWVKGMQGYMLRLLYIYWYWILPNKQKLALVYVCEHHKPFLQCPFASYTIYIVFFLFFI